MQQVPRPAWQGGASLLDQNQPAREGQARWWLRITLVWSHGPGAGDVSFKCPPYQVPYVGALPT